MKRRNFIEIGVLSPLITLPALPGMGETVPDRSFVFEKEKKIPVKDNFDVVVCGAGPAGVTSAISAARNGARVLLIELQGSLGGVWTSGLLSWILDQNNKSGLLREIINELKIREAVSNIPTGSSLSFDVEEMKLLLEELCIDSGVEIRLHTRIVGTFQNCWNI